MKTPKGIFIHRSQENTNYPKCANNGWNFSLRHTQYYSMNERAAVIELSLPRNELEALARAMLKVLEETPARKSE